MKVLKTFLLTVIFVTVFGINSVYAIEIEAPPTSGSGDWASVCNGNGYCYNSMGLRFTLYKYVNSTTAQKVGYSHDFWRYDTQCNNRTSSACTSDYERRPWDYGYVGNNHSKPQIFSDPKASDVIRDKKNGTEPGASKFSLNVDGYKNGRQNYYTVVDENIWSFRRDPVNHGDLGNINFRTWLANTTSNKLINMFDSYDEIQNIYDLSDAQIQHVKDNPKKYFFTAEMLGSISTNNASSRPSGFNKNKNYVGTVFELNQFYNHTGIFNRYAKALFLYNLVYMDEKIIVGPSNSSQSYILKTAGNTINQANIWSNRAIGMTVFKLTDIIKTCSATCGGTSGNARLKCAENYCENDPLSTDSSKKKACIVACGYSDPGNSTCSANTCINTNSATCQTTNKITSRTCSASKYYKTECTEYLTLNYSSGLPKVFINSLGGFNYFVDTNGTKSCTLIFNTRKYEFEYAALKRSDRISSSDPIMALNKFQSLATHATDEKYKCKWDDSDTIKMTVNDDDTKSLHKKIDNNSATTVASTNGTVHNYSGSSTTTLTRKVEATFESKNTSSWELPQMCYHLKDNTQEVLWNSTTKDLTCKKDDKADGKAATFYYGYYIKKVTDADGNLIPKVPVDVKVTKESLENDSCINENKCYYLNETDDKTKTAECNISFEKTGDRTYKVKYNVTNRSDLAGVSCKFGDSIVNCNNPQQKEITINPNNTMKVDGSVTYTTASGNNVTVSCPVIIRNKETPVGSKTCKGPGPDSYKPANYAGIKKYCREHWDTDTAGYGSYDSCVSDCSNQDGRELCENIFKPNQTTYIKNWCHNNYKDSGYKSEDSCINTCTTTKIGEGYTYRPIALGESGDSRFKFNAFPKRDAGTNWKGYEQKYTVDDNDYNEQPIYVINLSADNIKRIKQDTKNSGENVYADFNGEYATDGLFFRSEYVNNTSIFTRVNEYYWKEAD